MPFKPCPTELFRKFLIHIGCHFIEVSKHEKWGKKGLLRNIIFRHSEKEIPPMHIETNLKTLGMTRKQFDDIIKTLK